MLDARAVGLCQRAVMLAQFPGEGRFGRLPLPHDLTAEGTTRCNDLSGNCASAGAIERVVLAGVGAVALPAFSDHARQGAALKTAYLNALEHMTAVQWPALALLAIMAEPIVSLFYGSQWDDAIPIVRIFTAVASMLNFPTAPELSNSGRCRSDPTHCPSRIRADGGLAWHPRFCGAVRDTGRCFQCLHHCSLQCWAVSAGGARTRPVPLERIHRRDQEKCCGRRVKRGRSNGPLSPTAGRLAARRCRSPSQPF